ncbi:MAG: shikimate kinase [Chitinophagaceae bacterium]|nr:shikimate kinase [Chitinophagaceae bacterium]
MRIFLTGMMGCGKTFWGKKIAAIHQCTFVDLDAFIEAHLQMTIAAIFQQKGEDYFRIKERDCLHMVIARYSTCVIATGGGTPCFFDNLKIMKEAGRVVYLKTAVSILAARIRQTQDVRPMLKTADEKELNASVERLLALRKIFYEQSDLIIEMNQMDESKFAENLSIYDL